MVAAMRRRVDLPAPSEPTSPKIVPSSTDRETSWRASTSPKCMQTPSMDTKGTEEAMASYLSHASAGMPVFRAKSGLGMETLTR